MSHRHHNLGRRVSEFATPALMVDLDVFEANCRTLAGALAADGVDWRPHVKGHKSPRLAQLAAAAGACGVTCAKVDEAETMVAAGIDSVLVANQPSTPDAWERLARLNRAAWVAACVDADFQIDAAIAAGDAAGTSIPLLIEVDIGLNRAGVKSPEQGVELVEYLVGAGAEFAGVMGYEGHLLTIWPHADKARAIGDAVGLVIGVKDAIEAAGHPVGIVSCGGSGSYDITAKIDGVTEIQAGGGCLMDVFYRDQCHVDLEHALFVVGSVGSLPGPDRAIVDTGWKALSDRLATAECRDRPDVKVAQLYAEHCRVESADGGPINLEPHERIVFVPGYSDATTVLHNEFVGVRAGVGVEIIPLAARGGLQ